MVVRHNLIQMRKKISKDLILMMMMMEVCLPTVGGAVGETTRACGD